MFREFNEGSEREREWFQKCYIHIPDSYAILQDFLFECFPHEYLNVKRTFIPFFDPFHWYDSAYLAMCIDIVNKSPIKNSFQIHIKCNSNVIFYNARIQKKKTYKYHFNSEINHKNAFICARIDLPGMIWSTCTFEMSKAHSFTVFISVWQIFFF